MRVHHFAAIDVTQLATVIGGCGKKCCPQPQPQPTTQPQGPRASVAVATGAQGGEATSRALQTGL